MNIRFFSPLLCIVLSCCGGGGGDLSEQPSAKMVVISGVIADDAIEGALVEIQSTEGAVLAKATTDAGGLYSTSEIPEAKLAPGWRVYASGGKFKGIDFKGALVGLYSGSANNYSASHATLFTTALAQAAVALEATVSGQIDAAERLAVASIQRGVLPLDWKNPLNTSTQLANAQFAALPQNDGFSEVIRRLSGLYSKEPPSNIGQNTRCIPIEQSSNDRRCWVAVVGGVSVDIYDSESPNANIIANIQKEAVKKGCVIYVSAEITQKDNAISFSLEKQKSSGDSIESCWIGPMQVTLPKSENPASAPLLDSCKKTSSALTNHSFLPVCLTDSASILPGIFVIEDSRSHRHTTNIFNSTTGLVSISRKYGAVLYGMTESPFKATNAVPVLLIHGFTAGEVGNGSSVSDKFGGDDGTWGGLPQLIASLPAPLGVSEKLIFAPYNFQWRTDASFLTVSEDLEKAISYLYKSSGGQPIHIIAHSFGGVLARVLLQNISKKKDVVSYMVASLTTVGSPHSGINDRTDDLNVHGTLLPKGWDLPILDTNLCYQISCFEAGGSPNIPDWAKNESYQKGSGELIAALASTEFKFQPGLKVQVLIGQKEVASTSTGQKIFGTGDSLITYAGQRFLPSGTEISNGSELAHGLDNVVGARASARLSVTVSERVLGLPVGVAAAPTTVANDASFSTYWKTWQSITGYLHANPISVSSIPTEVYIPNSCSDLPADCQHDTWLNIKSFLLSFHGGEVSPNFASIAPRSLNDTGVTTAQCNAAGIKAVVNCDNPAAIALSRAQDGMVGLDVTAADSTDGKLGASYLKLDESGNAVDAPAASWACVKDSTSALTWEMKTADGKLRDGRVSFTNFGDGRSGDASAYVAAVNATALCGYKDWRLPTVLELQSILDFGSYGAAFDTQWFPNTPFQLYTWSSTPSAADPAMAWRARFDVGDLAPAPRSTAQHVRLVRGATRKSVLTVASDGASVADGSTKLVWRRCPEGMTASSTTCTGQPLLYTHEAALARARDEALRTGEAWRVPNIKELSSVLEFGQAAPFVDTSAFPGWGATAVLWSSTPFVKATDGWAWYVGLTNLGTAGITQRSANGLAVRLVKDQ